MAQSVSDNVRVAVYGAGAVGTALGAYISASGRQIDLITRDVEHVRALRRDGANIVGPNNFVTQVSALTPDEMSGEYDVIFLTTRQRENSEICKFLSDYLSDDGVICTLQNGMPEPAITREVGVERCLGCTVLWSAVKRKAGVVEITTKKEKAFAFELGSLTQFNGMEQKLNIVKDLLACMGKVIVQENFLGARWAKLAINSSLSSVSALTGLTFGEIVRGKTSRQLALNLFNETVYVAEKCGVELVRIQGYDLESSFYCGEGSSFKRNLALLRMPHALRCHANSVSGTYFDLKQGKKSDIDYINGFVAHTGKRFGVPTPLNLKVIELAHEMENGRRKPSSGVVEWFFG